MNQKGFTLIEILVALPIGAAILLVVISGYFQITQGRVNIAQKSIAMNDIDNVVHRLSQDLNMAQITDLVEEDPPVSEMILEWSDLTHWAADISQIDHSVTYTLFENKLYRNYDGEITIIGRYLTYVGFSISDRVFTANITSQPGLPASAVHRIMNVEMRTDEMP